MSAAGRIDAVPLPENCETQPALQNGRRSHGRDLEEFRPAFMQTKSVSQAAGSAYVEFADTKVMAAVYGPRQSERKLGYQDSGRIQCEVRLTSFAGGAKLKAGQASTLDKDLSHLLYNALAPAVQLHTFPKAVVDVHCMLLSSGGSDAAAVIVAASLALADAGIQMYDLVPACCVSQLGGHLLLDPCLQENMQQESGMMLACMPMLNEVTKLSMSGNWSSKQWQEALELGLAGCAQLRESMRETLLQAAAEAGKA